MRERPKISYFLFPSPVGWLGVAAGEGWLVNLLLHPGREEADRRMLESFPHAVREESGPIRKAGEQIEAYFEGTRRAFDLPLDFRGLPPFTAQVLRTLQEVPFGERITYGELAAFAGRPGAARAIGRAMAVNPFPIVVPCHRVVGAGGRITGYSGGEGIATKEWLLGFEERCGMDHLS